MGAAVGMAGATAAPRNWFWSWLCCTAPAPVDGIAEGANNVSAFFATSLRPDCVRTSELSSTRNEVYGVTMP